MTENPFEIPQAMREQAEQNMKQAHAAYEQLTNFVTKAMAPGWARCRVPWPLASRMCKAAPCKSRRKMPSQCSRSPARSAMYGPPQDIVTLETQFAQDRMQAFAAQTQELQRLMGETLQKLQRG